MTHRILFGCINGLDGSKYSGTDGFEVKHVAEGTYLVDFDPAFKSAPAVVATQKWAKGAAWGDCTFEGGDTRDNVVLVCVSKEHCKLITGDSGGERKNRAFTFIAIGD